MNNAVIDMSYLPTLPQAPELEEQVLACFFAEKDKPELIMAMVTQLQPEDFYSTLHQEVFKACLELFQAGKPLDEAFVNDRLRQNLSHIQLSGDFVEGLRWKYSGIDLDEAIQTLKVKSVNRQLITGFYGLLADSVSTHSPDLVNQAQALIMQLSKHQNQQTEAVIGNILPNVIAEVEQRWEQGVTMAGVASGFPKLDALIGGLQKTRLITLCARTGIGKTSFALQVAMNVARNSQTVLYCSLEMGKEELAARALCQFERVDSSVLRSGTLDETTYKRLLKGLEGLGGVPLVIDDAPQTIASIRAKALRTIARHGDLSLLVVDYLGLVRTDTKGDANRYQAVSAIVRGLKDLALEFKIPVLCLAQPNRDVDKRGDNKLRLSDLKDSGEIEQASDIVIFLNRKSSEQKLTLDVAKQRNGPLGEIDYRFEPQTTSFREVW